MESAFDNKSNDFASALAQYGANQGSIAQGRLTESEQMIMAREQMAQATAATKSSQAFSDFGTKVKARGGEIMEAIGVDASAPGVVKGVGMFSSWLANKALSKAPKVGEPGSPFKGPRERQPGEGTEEDVADDADDFLGDIGQAGRDFAGRMGGTQSSVPFTNALNRPGTTLVEPSTRLTRETGTSTETDTTAPETDMDPDTALGGGRGRPGAQAGEDDDNTLDLGPRAGGDGGVTQGPENTGPEPDLLPDPEADIPDITADTGRAAGLAADVEEEIAPLAAETSSTWSSVAGMAGSLAEGVSGIMPWMGPLAAAAGIGIGIYGIVEGDEEAESDAPYNKANQAIAAANLQLKGMAGQISADQFAEQTGSNVPSYGSLAAPVFSTASVPSSFGHF